MPRFRLKSLKAGIGPLGGEVEVSPGERALLYPLFVALRDKRALLYTPHGREDSDYVTKSIDDIREELAAALKALGPDSRVRPWLERLRKACREYLDAVADTQGRRRPSRDFAPALAQLRDAFREIAGQVADRYDLPPARELVDEMDQADEAWRPAIEARAEEERLEEGVPPPGQISPPASSPESAPVGASGPLVAALDDSDSMVRFTAMSALRDHLDQSLLPVLEPLLQDRDSDIRQYAVEYYARLNPPDTQERLVAALDDSDSMVRFIAMSALRDHLDQSLLPVLEPLLQDRDSDIRQYAVEYYARLHSR